MPTEAHVIARLRAAFPDATIEVVDYTGTGDHFKATIESEQFAGVSRVLQHKLVYAALDGDIGDHSIHALALTTRIPAAMATAPNSQEPRT
ncbi:MAG: BolA family transcriptional regulator [Thermoleophilia bacterium]|nr:BolA family transcriptional regulator [Thermoleophilia bacterium]